MSVYLDYQAAKPVDPRAFDVMKPYFTKEFGNPSSLHNYGYNATNSLEEARRKITEFINAPSPDNIIFSSGATESNNLAITGVIKALKKQGIKKPHIITSSIEHPAILAPCKKLEKEGIEVTYLPVKSNGVVDMDKFKKAIKKNTVLVSVMHVNNEVGSIQPIREIGKTIKKINEKNEN